jgi:hypothetical protein
VLLRWQGMRVVMLNWQGELWVPLEDMPSLVHLG